MKRTAVFVVRDDEIIGLCFENTEGEVVAIDRTPLGRLEELDLLKVAQNWATTTPVEVTGIRITTRR